MYGVHHPVYICAVQLCSTWPHRTARGQGEEEGPGQPPATGGADGSSRCHLEQWHPAEVGPDVSCFDYLLSKRLELEGDKILCNNNGKIILYGIATCTKVWWSRQIFVCPIMCFLCSILCAFILRRSHKKCRELWWQGLPSCVRGKVWKLAIGNDLNITPELYSIMVQR